MLPTKERAKRHANAIRTDLLELEALAPADTAAGQKARSLHTKLNRVLRWAAEHFGEDEAAFSGGTDKPPGAAEDDDEGET